MPSAVGSSGTMSAASITGFTGPLQSQAAQEQATVQAAKLAERLGSQAAAPPPSGRAQIVDRFA